MATILFTWELGEGLGHLAQIAPLAEELSHRGHKVVAALRDLSRAARVFEPGSASFLQAPHRTRFTASNTIQAPRTFAHILYNTGFGDATELSTMAQAWAHLYRLVQPNVIVFDHSPTALLASRAGPAKRVLLGSGFCAPPDAYPMPDLWPTPCDPRQLVALEDLLLKQVNHLLEAWRRPTLDRISQLYAQVDENFLTTYPELDHYSGRKGATYWGDYERVVGNPPKWPDGPGKKMFAYLKPFPALPQLLEWLKSSGHRIIIYGDGIAPELHQRMSSPTLRFEDHPLDMSLVSKECDTGILNATHSTTVALLRAGKPALHVPRVLEQWLLAKAVVRMGAGLDAAPTDADATIRGMQSLLSSPQYQNAAERFAKRYAGEDRAAQVQKIADRLEVLAKT